MNKRRTQKVILPVTIWDTVWKLVAIRRAVQLRHYKMIPLLAVTNSAGLLPIGYLWKNRGAQPAADEGHLDESTA